MNCYRYKFFILLSLMFVFALPILVQAITLDKNSYTTDDRIYTVGFSSGRISIWNLDDYSFVLSRSYYNDGDDLTFSNNSLGSFAIIETTETYCGEGHTYDECKNSPDFVNEFLFSIAPSSGGEGSSSGGGSPVLSVNKSSFTPGETVHTTCSSSSYSMQLYDVTSGINGENSLGGNIGIFPCSSGQIIFDSVLGHSYVIIEVADALCNNQNYSVCISNTFGNTVAVVGFNIIVEETQQSSGIISYRPEVTVLSPKLGAVFSHDAIIEYSAVDKNDKGSQFEKDLVGFTVNPVSIFYSDKIVEWDHSIIPPDLKSLIVKGLPAIGSYTWKITDLIPGVFYRIIVDAIDMVGDIGEDISDFFTVDFSAPVFNLSVNPGAVRSGDVTIVVDSSKDLASPPKVAVTQNGGKSVEVELVGEASHFEGVYTVIGGFDGTAKISVSGTDIAGNNGTTIVGGGTFSVGVDAPPKPKITSHSLLSVSTEELVKLSGVAREDTSVFLVINGVSTRETKPDSNGVFVFDKIKLEKIKNFGLNYISIFVKDANGTQSESDNIKIKFNTAPVVSITNPAENSVLEGQATITAKASDGNQDPLLFTYEVIPLKDYSPNTTSDSWIKIVDNIPSSSFVWNTTEVDDGQYVLRAFVNDGTAVATSSTINLLIKNTLPFFRFEDGRKTITNKNTATVVGRAITPPDLSPRPNIASIEYSLDNGKKWRKATSTDQVGPEQRFLVVFPNLSEGVYPIQWRVKDSRGLSSKTVHSVVVDSTSPKSPDISFPMNNQVLSDENDEDNKKDGMQISVLGKTEGGSSITISLDGKTSIVKGRPDGVIVLNNLTVTGLGLHEIKVFATDVAGNKSPEKIISFVYNNPPTVTFVHPKPFKGISGQDGKESIVWKIEDKDKDKINGFTLSFRKGNDAYKILTKDNSESKFLWDISSLPEGNDYELKIDVTDGTTAVSSKASFSIDRTPPVLVSNIDKSVLGKDDSLIIEGVAKDTLSGVEFVEYSIVNDNVINNEGNDNSIQDWFQGVITSGYLKNKANFLIKYPSSISDGKYSVLVRSVDVAGNVSTESSHDFVVDVSPPRVGSFMAKNNNINVSPDKSGVLSVYRDSTFTFAISLESDTANASVNLNGEKFELKKDVSTGLWQTELVLDSQSDVDILISAEDEVHNLLVDKNIGSLHLLSQGTVIHILDGVSIPLSDVSLHVLQLNENTKTFTLLQTDGSTTESKTNDKGNYSLALPAGTYRIVVEKGGFKIAMKEITIPTSEFISLDFIMIKYSGIAGLFDRIIDWIRY